MNSHGVADFAYELQTTIGDLLPACVVSTTPPVPVSGLTLAAFATRAYVRAGQQLTYVDQPAVTVTLVGGDGTYWLAVTDDTFSAFSGWTRRPGSHYMWRLSATRPADLDNLLVFSQLTVSGGNISAVSTPWGVAPPLALATADKVSLGGHTPTGVLDVQGSVVASDVANNYIGVRAWPVTPSGATFAVSLRVEAATGVALATASCIGLQIINQPTMANVYGIYSGISAGPNRYNFYAQGSAQNFFAGNVGIANPTPTYPLDVTGIARVTGVVGVGGNPDSNYGLVLTRNKSAMHGLQFKPTTADSGTSEVVFVNVAGTVVGSISSTAAATSFNTSSDVRLKHAVQALGNALAAIQALRPVRFRWNADDSADEGFLAHELQQVLPHAVTGEPDALNDDGSIRPQQVDHSKIVVWLVSAVQELAARLDAAGV